MFVGYGFADAAPGELVRRMRVALAAYGASFDVVAILARENDLAEERCRRNGSGASSRGCRSNGRGWRRPSAVLGREITRKDEAYLLKNTSSSSTLSSLSRDEQIVASLVSQLRAA